MKWTLPGTVLTADREEAKYIENQLKEDHMSEQLMLDKVDPFTGNKK